MSEEKPIDYTKRERRRTVSRYGRRRTCTVLHGNADGRKEPHLSPSDKEYMVLGYAADR